MGGFFFGVKLSSIFFARLLSLIVIALLWMQVEYEKLLALYTALLFSHYIIAHYSAFKGYKKTGISKHNLVSLLFMLILAYFMTLTNAVDILVFFSLHFVFSEMYLNEFFGRKQDRILRVIKSIFYMSFYIVILFHYPYFKAINPMLALGLMIGSFIGASIYSLVKKIEFQYHDLLFLISGVIVYIYKFEFYAYLIVMLHLVLWCIIPLLRSPKGAAPMMMGHLILFVAFYYIDLQATMGHLVYEPKSVLGFFGFLHISLTFASSGFNPSFIQNLFGFKQLNR